MKETRWDCVEFAPPEIPYRESLSPFNYEPCWKAGSQNCYVDYTGAMQKRFDMADTLYNSPLTGKVVRTWIYETLPQSAYSPPHPSSFILASVYNGTSYKLFWKYFPVGAEPTSVGWSASATDLRNMNTSMKPHLVTFAKGLAYVKCFPDAGQDKYGTVILKGVGTGTMSVYPWGLPGPTAPAALLGDATKFTAAVAAADATFNVVSTTGFPASGTLWVGYEKVTYSGVTATTFTGVTRGVGGTKAEAYEINEIIRNLEFDASDHKVDVQFGWTYSFAYVSITGQVSNRADIQRNPDLMPSNTGPFFDMNPKMTLTLDSFFYNDTTNYPYLNVYRTTDGGGTFYFLEQVANPGTSTLTYEDDSFGTGASSTTYNDPVPDDKIDTARYAPSLTSNTPPTPVIPPDVIGTNTPSQDCWSMTTYVGRIWYGIGQYLFFSSREETRDGIGEECFPSGNLGNFFILDAGIVGVAATDDALYVATTKDIWKLQGSTLETFVINKQFADVGVATFDTPLVSFKNKIAFIAETGTPGLIEGDNLRLIGDKVPTFTTAAGFGGASACINYYNTIFDEWLMFYAGVADEASSTNASIYIYDIKKSQKLGIDFWHPVWSVGTTTLVSGPVNNGGALQGSRLFTSNWNSTANRTSVSNFQTSSYSDYYMQNGGTTTTRAITAIMALNVVRAPAGNHLNSLNIPAKDVNLYGLLVHYGPTNSVLTTPSVSVTLDSKTASEGGGTQENPWRIQYGTTSPPYESYFYPFNTECQNVKIQWTHNTIAKGFIIYAIVVMFDPKANP